MFVYVVLTDLCVRDFSETDARSLWITQVNAAAREHGMQYSRFVNALGAADIELNRKVLSELAITEPLSFRAVLEVCKNIKKE